MNDSSHQQPEDSPSKLPTIQDELLYQAWAVIANAGSGMGGWEHESGEWVKAAERWRDQWHSYLAASKDNK